MDHEPLHPLTPRSGTNIDGNLPAIKGNEEKTTDMANMQIFVIKSTQNKVCLYFR